MADAPALYGFRLRPVHSSSIPYGVGIRAKLRWPGFDTHGAGLLTRALTPEEQAHFDLVEIARDIDPVNAHVLRQYEAHRNDPGTWCAVRRITFGDGDLLSVQASEGHYCSPKSRYGPWASFEVGPADHRVYPELRGYRSSPKDTRDVHGWVPVDVLLAIAARKGGVR